MKIVVEPTKMKQLLKQTLFHKGKPLLESAIASARPDGIAFLDLSLQVIGYYAKYAKNYFLEYECQNPELTTLSKHILDKLNDAFKEAKQITIATTEEKIFLRSERETFDDDLVASEKPELPFKFVKNASGVVPEQFIPIVRIAIATNELDFPEAVEYKLKVTNDKKIMLEITDIGKYTKELLISNNPNIEQILTPEASILLDGDYFKRITSNLSGEVILSFDKTGWFCLYEQATDHSITYYLAEKTDITSE